VWHPELWPFTQRASHLLRMGQAFIQLWQADGRHWRLLDSRSAHHLDHNQYQPLVELVASLTRTLPEKNRLQVLADSKWMPISLLPTGKHPLSGDQLSTLARHRFLQIFGDEVNGWAIQTTYVAGDEQTMAFACPTSLESGLRECLKQQLNGLAPTLSWAWNHAWRSVARRHSACLALAEHDRSIFVWLSSGQTLAMQPAGPRAQNPGQLLKAVQIEALRCGVANDANAIYGASFESMPVMTTGPGSDGLQWMIFEAEEVMT